MGRWRSSSTYSPSTPPSSPLIQWSWMRSENNTQFAVRRDRSQYPQISWNWASIQTFHPAAIGGYTSSFEPSGRYSRVQSCCHQDCRLL